MANYNFYANYGSPQGGGRGQDQLSQVLQLYNMVLLKRERQARDIDKYGTELAAIATSRSVLDNYKEDSPYLQDFLQRWDYIDDTMTQRVYDKLGKGRLTSQDLADLYKWKTERAREFGRINSSITQYQEDLKTRAQLSYNSQGTYIFLNNQPTLDDYLTNPNGSRNINNGTSVEKVAGMTSTMVKSILSQKANDASFNDLYGGMILQTLQQPSTNWKDVLNTVMNSEGNPLLKERAETLLKELESGIKTVKDQIDFDNFDERGQQKINDAIYQGTWAGMQPVQTSYQQHPDYVNKHAREQEAARKQAADIKEAEIKYKREQLQHDIQRCMDPSDTLEGMSVDNMKKGSAHITNTLTRLKSAFESNELIRKAMRDSRKAYDSIDKLLNALASYQKRVDSIRNNPNKSEADRQQEIKKIPFLPGLKGTLSEEEQEEIKNLVIEYYNRVDLLTVRKGIIDKKIVDSGNIDAEEEAEEEEAEEGALNGSTPQNPPKSTGGAAPADSTHTPTQGPVNFGGNGKIGG